MAIGFFSLLLVSLFSTQYDIEEVQQHCNHAFSQQEIVSLYERFCQLDHSGGGFIFVAEFLSVLEFAPNPLSQFWRGGRRYWGRGIGARPHLLLGRPISFSHQRDLIQQQSYLVLGVNSERYSRDA